MHSRLLRIRTSAVRTSYKTVVPRPNRLHPHIALTGDTLSKSGVLVRDRRRAAVVVRVRPSHISCDPPIPCFAGMLAAFATGPPIPSKRLGLTGDLLGTPLTLLPCSAEAKTRPVGSERSTSRGVGCEGHRPSRTDEHYVHSARSARDPRRIRQ